MHSCQAWEMLNDPERSCRLGMDEFRDLLIRAGYSVKAADAAARQRGWDRLAAGESA